MVMSKGVRFKLVGIPLLALLITVFFFNHQDPRSSPYFLTVSFLVCLGITFVMWVGNEAVFDFFHKKYPTLEETFKRVFFIGVCCICYTVTFSIVIDLLLNKPLRYEDLLFDLKITLLFTTLVVLLYEAIFFFGQWKDALLETEKFKKETVQAQLDSLRNQVNPHFLFNSLNTLVSIIPENPNTAVDFVQKLSSVYRYLLSVKERELVPLATELDFIQSYLFLLKVRFEENLQVKILIPQEAQERLLPPISLQLLIENAIKHNVISREKPLHITLTANQETLTVHNNLQPKQQWEESTGVGLENIKARYSILSILTIQVSKTHEGFSVSLPLL